jgi:MFS superfamily sulfate permease-like transporter
MGNAVIAVTGENNRLFPARPTTVKKVALSTGAMNLAGGLIGGIPMCHGAGGMAAYTAFGARSGGAPIIFGSALLLLAVGFSGAIDFVLQAVPAAVLGALLLLAGLHLVAGNLPRGGAWRAWRSALPLVVTAALASWHVGLAFLVGVLLCRLLRAPSGQA